jgi:hypothetical protein
MPLPSKLGVWPTFDDLGSSRARSDGELSAVCAELHRQMRRSTITLSLFIGGMIVGAFAGATLLALALALTGDNPFAADVLDVPLVAAGVGAIVGALAAPAAGWGLLRRVPLWKAALVTSAGTVAGGVVGELVRPLNQMHDNYLPGIIPGALIGFVVATLSLAIWFRRSTAVAAQPSNGEL